MVRGVRGLLRIRRSDGTLARSPLLVLVLVPSVFVAAACSNSPATPAHASASATKKTGLLPDRVHAPGSTSTTAARGTSTTTAGGGSGSTLPTLGVTSAWGPSAV